MTRSWRALAVGAVLVLGGLVAAPATEASAATPTPPNLGTLVFVPAHGTNLTGIHVRTPIGCPTKADAYYMSVRGHGFPKTGQIVTENTAAGLSHTIGFDAYFLEIMRDYATDNGASGLSGRYDATLYCIDSFRQTVFATMTGSITYVTPTTYRAVGASAGTATPPVQPSSSTAASTGASTGASSPAPSSAAVAPAGSGTPVPTVTVPVAGAGAGAAAPSSGGSSSTRVLLVVALAALALAAAAGMWMFRRRPTGAHGS